MVHLAWMVSPVILLTLIPRGGRWRWIVAAIAAAGAAFYDPNPLFWISFGLGVWVLVWCVRTAANFPAGGCCCSSLPAMLVFFAGSARYLLPVAAPLAILAANASRRSVAIAGAALQLALALGLAVVNYQHWNTYRHYVEILMDQAHGRRIWVNADWGLRYYLEAAGGVPLTKATSGSSMIQPGDIVVTSDLSNPSARRRAPDAALSNRDSPAAAAAPDLTRRPLRVFVRLARPAAFRDFARAHRPRACRHRHRAGAELSRPAHDPKAAAQFLSGISADGWTAQQATVLLKVPEGATTLSASVYIDPKAPARHLRLSVNGRYSGRARYPGPRSLHHLRPRAARLRKPRRHTVRR